MVTITLTSADAQASAVVTVATIM